MPATTPTPPADVWVIAGAPGAGKSTVADALLAQLDPTPALLDKDVLFAGFVDEVQRAHGKTPGEREGQWYDEHVKVHEYTGMTQAAAQIRSTGCPVLLVAPFSQQLRDPGLWQRWVSDLGGDHIRLLWVRCDPATLQRRLIERGSPRDAGKLDAFDAFIQRIAPDTPPPAPHHQIDNRDGAPPIAEQVAALLSKIHYGRC